MHEHRLYYALKAVFKSEPVDEYRIANMAHRFYLPERLVEVALWQGYALEHCRAYGKPPRELDVFLNIYGLWYVVPWKVLVIYPVVSRVAETEVGELYSFNSIRVHELFEARQVLPPVEVRVYEVLVPVLRPPCEFVKIRELVRENHGCGGSIPDDARVKYRPRELHPLGFY